VLDGESYKYRKHVFALQEHSLETYPVSFRSFSLNILFVKKSCFPRVNPCLNSASVWSLPCVIAFILSAQTVLCVCYISFIPLRILPQNGFVPQWLLLVKTGHFLCLKTCLGSCASVATTLLALALPVRKCLALTMQSVPFPVPVVCAIACLYDKILCICVA